MFGSSGMRCAVAAAIALTLPASRLVARQVDRREIELRVAADHRGHRVRRAAERHMDDVDAGGRRNCAPAMNVVLARPGEEKLSLPGCVLGELDDLLERLGRNVRIA